MKHNILATILAIFSVSANAISLDANFGGSSGFGTSVLGPNDDDSSGPMTFSTPLNFFGSTYSSFYINNNGNLSFAAANPGFTPDILDLNVPIIAPYFADVDTRVSGNVFFGTSGNRFAVTWVDVGYYNQKNDKLNSFQLIVTDRSANKAGDFDVDFLFETLEWTTGDASGGTNGFGGFAARSGFFAGDGITHYQWPDSGSSSVLNLVYQSNIGVAGLQQFSFRDGQIISTVPIPAAIWLFGSAVWLLGWTMRNKS